MWSRPVRQNGLGGCAQGESPCSGAAPGLTKRAAVTFNDYSLTAASRVKRVHQITSSHCRRRLCRETRLVCLRYGKQDTAAAQYQLSPALPDTAQLTQHPLAAMSCIKKVRLPDLVECPSLCTHYLLWTPAIPQHPVGHVPQRYASAVTSTQITTRDSGVLCSLLLRHASPSSTSTFPVSRCLCINLPLSLRRCL